VPVGREGVTSASPELPGHHWKSPGGSERDDGQPSLPPRCWGRGGLLAQGLQGKKQVLRAKHQQQGEGDRGPFPRGLIYDMEDRVEGQGVLPVSPPDVSQMPRHHQVSQNLTGKRRGERLCCRSHSDRITEGLGLEGTFKHHPVQLLLPWARTSSTRSGCSKPHPT